MGGVCHIEQLGPPRKIQHSFLVLTNKKIRCLELIEKFNSLSILTKGRKHKMLRSEIHPKITVNTGIEIMLHLKGGKLIFSNMNNLNVLG